MRIKYLVQNTNLNLILIAVIFGSLIANFVLVDTHKAMASTIDSTSFLYPFKRVLEVGISHTLLSKNIRVNYDEGLIKDRVDELKYVITHNILTEIKPTSERFAYQAGIVVEELKSLNNKDKTSKVFEDFKSYSRELSKLRDSYEANSAYWLYIQYDIDTLKILSDKIKE